MQTLTQAMTAPDLSFGSRLRARFGYARGLTALLWGRFALLPGPGSRVARITRDALEHRYYRTGGERLRRLLRWLVGSDCELKTMADQAADIRHWPDYLQAVFLPLDWTADQAACAAEVRLRDVQLALLIFAHNRCVNDAELARFLVISHRRFGERFQQLVRRTDYFLWARDGFVDRIEDLLRGRPPAKPKAKPAVTQHPWEADARWQEFVRRWRCSPFAALGSRPTDSLDIIRRRFRRRLLAVHPDRNTAVNASEATQMTTLAWEVVRHLHQQGRMA